MVYNYPKRPLNQTPPSAPPVYPESSKTKIIVIFIIILIILIGAAWLFWQWRGNQSDDLIQEIQAGDEGARVLQNTADELTTNSMSAEPVTPEEKFAKAEIIEIPNNDHDSTAEELGKTLFEVFGEYKITGYTQGYMGMNSGSGVAQYTFIKILSLESAESLKQAMEDQGFDNTILDKTDGSVNIQAEHKGYKYRLTYNQNEQELTAIIEKIH